MFRGKHRHLIRVDWLVPIVDYRLIRLLVVFTIVVANYLITLHVDDAWALSQFAVLLKLLFVVKTGRPVLLGLWETASLGAWLRDGAVTVLIFLVGQIDLRLIILIRIGGENLGNLGVYI